MKVPTTDSLSGWAREIIDECLVSREDRRSNYAFFKTLYYTGSDNSIPAKHNMCFSHIDKLSSYLFSPAYLRFNLEFEADETKTWSEPVDVVTRHFNREFNRRRMGVSFAQGVDVALVKGCAIAKITWGHAGLEPHIIQPDFFGVLREDIEDLDGQDAFVHSYYLTPAQFRRMMHHDPKGEAILREVEQHNPTSNNELEDNYIHEIIVGGIQPIGIGAPTGQKGSVASVATPPGPRLSPNVAEKLIRVDDLWFVNDDARKGEGDWNTIRMVGDIIIEGRYQLRNLSQLPGKHPFVKICPNEVPGYFWGLSELAGVAPLQVLLNQRTNDADNIFRLGARPPRAFSGFSNITDEKARALLSAGGTLTDPSAVSPKIESLAPAMPAGLMDYIEKIERDFDQQGGFTAITSGQGEAGVRAGTHANTLLRTSAPRLLDRGLIVEGQCASYGDLALDYMQLKDPRVFQTPDGKREFMLSQLPDDITVMVDTHTSSPAFSGDTTNLAFALARVGAINGEGVLKLTHPPFQEEFIMQFREREKKQAEFLQQHPELLTKGSHKPK